MSPFLFFFLYILRGTLCACMLCVCLSMCVFFKTDIFSIRYCKSVYKIILNFALEFSVSDG